MRWGEYAIVRVAATAILALLPLLAVSAVLPRESLADGFSGYLEFASTRNDTKLSDASGRAIQSKSDSLSQSY